MVVSTEAAAPEAMVAQAEVDLEGRRAVLRGRRRRQALRDWLWLSITGLAGLVLAVMTFFTLVGGR